MDHTRNIHTTYIKQHNKQHKQLLFINLLKRNAMKKYFMLLAAAATVLAVSCAKEKNQPTTDPTPGVVEEEDTTPQPVRFGSNIAEVKAPITKGLGAVDNWSNISGATNPGKLYIYGLERTSQTATTYVWNVQENAIHPFINNVAADAPAAGSGLDRRDAIQVLDVNNIVTPGENPEYGPFYYVDNKYYDFFGYYVDDAVNGAPAPVYTAATNEAAAQLVLDIEIDGTQDIMLANTDKAEDIAWRTDQSKQVNQTMLYSAVSARRTVVPNLNFEHKLSRFVFNVVAADAQVLAPARATSIQGLKLYSDYKGKLTIVGTQGLVPEQEQQKDAEEHLLYYVADDSVDPAVATWETTTTQTAFPVYFKGLAGTVNENFVLAVKPNENAPIPATAQYSDIMVYPGAHSYHFDLLMSQVGTPYTDADHAYVLPLDVTLPNEDVALAGKKYVVNVVVYGLEAVQMTVSLAEWDEVDLGWVDPDKTNDAARTGVTLTLAQNPTGNIVVGAENYAIQITGATTVGDSPSAIGDEALTDLKSTAYFKSSDNTKVRINKSTGVITAVAAGTATITVTVSDDTYYGSATIDVTVVAASLPVPEFAGLPATDINITHANIASENAADRTTAAVYSTCQYNSTDCDTAITITVMNGETPVNEGFTLNNDKTITVAKDTAAGTYAVTLHVAAKAGVYQAADATPFNIVIANE